MSRWESCRRLCFGAMCQASSGSPFRVWQPITFRLTLALHDALRGCMGTKVGNADETSEPHVNERGRRGWRLALSRVFSEKGMTLLLGSVVLAAVIAGAYGYAQARVTGEYSLAQAKTNGEYALKVKQLEIGATRTAEVDAAIRTQTVQAGLALATASTPTVTSTTERAIRAADALTTTNAPVSPALVGTPHPSGTPEVGTSEPVVEAQTATATAVALAYAPRGTIVASNGSTEVGNNTTPPSEQPNRSTPPAASTSVSPMNTPVPPPTSIPVLAPTNTQVSPTKTPLPVPSNTPMPPSTPAPATGGSFQKSQPYVGCDRVQVSMLNDSSAVLNTFRQMKDKTGNIVGANYDPIVPGPQAWAGVGWSTPKGYTGAVSWDIEFIDPSTAKTVARYSGSDSLSCP
jgi:hypothetical protein